MTCTFFTADWHLGHYNCRKWRNEEDDIDVDNHDELLFDNFVDVVTKRDLTWFLGDMIITRDHKELEYYLVRIDCLPGRKRLVLGNHDTDHMAGLRSPSAFEGVFEQVHAIRRHKRAWLTHVPMHPIELRGLCNIHGHMHRNIVSDERYINVSVEQTNYTPMRYQGWLQDHCQRLWEKHKEERRA